MTATRTRPHRFSAVTHRGLVRAVNEDGILARPDLNLWAVADGMGGHAGGDVASRAVIAALAALGDALDPAALLREARGALCNAHAAIRAEAASRGHAVIGATIVLLALSDDHFMCLWAGDSRLYRLRQGRLDMVSQDHSVVGEMVAAGQLTWDEADRHERANQITRAVGVGTRLDIDKRRGAIEPGDRFLLCSDGLTKYADNSALARHLAATSVETVADALLQRALDGGASDNVSVIAVEV